MLNLTFPPIDPPPWLRDAERLSAQGLFFPDIAAALSQLGYSETAVALAVAALKSDSARASRVATWGMFGRPM